MIDNIEYATKVQETALSVSSELNHSLLQMQEILTDDEFDQYRLAVAKVLGEIFMEILRPIHIAHPELIPDAMK